MKLALKVHVPGLGPDQSHYNQWRRWSRLHTTLAQITRITPKWICTEFFSFFWATCACPEKQSLPWNFSLYWRYFSPFRISEQLCTCPEIFHCIEYTCTFRIFEKLALALKNRVCSEFTVFNIYFLALRIFEQLALALKFFTVLKYFYHPGILSNLHLPWKQNLPWNFSSQGGMPPPPHTHMVFTT